MSRTKHRREKTAFGRSAGLGGSPIIAGRNALREVLTAAPERVRKIFAVPRISRDGGDLERLLAACAARGIPVVECTADELTELTGCDSHQSCAALLSQKEATDLKSVLAGLAGKPQALIVVLDSIEDPQNLGTILRACECFAVDCAIWSRNRGASLTAAAAKASVGASELVNHLEVANIADSLRKLREANFWLVAAEVRPGSVDVHKFDFPKRCALLMGAEGAGIHALSSKLCDFHVQIPIFGRIDSLNVSQALAILLHRYRSCHGPDFIGG